MWIALWSSECSVERCLTGFQNSIPNSKASYCKQKEVSSYETFFGITTTQCWDPGHSWALTSVWVHEGLWCKGHRPVQVWNGREVLSSRLIRLNSFWGILILEAMRSTKVLWQWVLLCCHWCFCSLCEKLAGNANKHHQLSYSVEVPADKVTTCRNWGFLVLPLCVPVGHPIRGV